MAKSGDTLTTLLAQNQAWSEVMKEVDSSFFDQLSSGHKPKCFWIGCSDARVSPNQITASKLGELFIYRNIGNQVVATDAAFNSALEYALFGLGVSHIVLCGHYCCGGVRAALSGESSGKQLTDWLQGMRGEFTRHQLTATDAKVVEENWDTACEININFQLARLCSSQLLHDYWGAGSELSIHPILFDLRSGLLKSQNVSVSSSDAAREVAATI